MFDSSPVHRRRFFHNPRRRSGVKRFLRPSCSQLASPEELETRVVLDSTTVFNEIMYHPADDGTPEWIELHNQMSVDMDLSGWSLVGGVEFEFAPGTVIAGGGFLVVSDDPQALANGTGYGGALGPFRGSLSNGGEQLELRNNNDRVMNVVDYDDAGQWPVGPDGSGATLAKAKEVLASEPADNWKTSRQMGGTPGAENFPAVSQSQSVLIDFNGEWKYDDTGTDLGTAWRQPAFDDANWMTGGALCFDTPADLPIPKATPLAHGHNTYYFRTDFQYDSANIPDELRLQPILDDGAVFYLNGTEFLRVNMPAGPIAFNTPALTGVVDATLTDVITFSTDQLAVGTNTLAVEVSYDHSQPPLPQGCLPV